MGAATLSLSGWGNIAQMVIAVAAALGLIYAAYEVRISRAQARLARVYDYADRFNRPETLAATAAYQDYWEKHSVDDWQALPRRDQLELMMLPNLAEEVAFLYNRKLLDRNVAAELLGLYIQRLWNASGQACVEMRTRRNHPSLFSEWEEMQKDVPRRQLKGVRKSERRRARSRLFRGE